MTRSISAPHINQGYGRRDAERLLDLARGPVDPTRLDFYRLLDESY